METKTEEAVDKPVKVLMEITKTLDIDLKCRKCEIRPTKGDFRLLLIIESIPESCILDRLNMEMLLDIIGKENAMNYWDLIEND